MVYNYVPTVPTLLAKYTKIELINMRVNKLSDNRLSESERERWSKRLSEAITILEEDRSE